MEIGQKAEITRRYSEDDIEGYALLAGIPEQDIVAVPEPLIAGLFSYLLGVKLPGAGTNYLKQELHYLQAAALDDSLTASVAITRLRPEKHLADLVTRCVNQDGALICEGRALVLVKDVGHPQRVA